MILLKQSVEPVLRELSFDGVYVDLNNGNELILAGKCGEPVLTFPGIKGRTTLNNKERAYITEILSDYLYNNQTEIENILNAIITKKWFSKPTSK